MKKKTSHRLWLTLCLLALAAGLLTACGRSEGERTLGIDGAVYIAGEPVLSGDEFFNDLKSRDGYLYYRTGGTLMRLSPGSGDGDGAGDAVPVLEFPGYPLDYDLLYHISDYAPGDNGDLYYCRQNFTEGMWKSEEYALLIRQTGDGDTVYETPIPIADLESDLQCDLAVDGEGRAYLLTRDCLYVVDAAGELIGAIPTEDYFPSSTIEVTWNSYAFLLEGEKGRVYFMTVPNGWGSTAIYEILTDSGCRLNPREDLIKDMNGTFYSSSYGLLCDKADGILYQYRLSDASWHPLLRWTDGYVNGGAVQVAQPSKDQVAAYYYTDAGGQLYLLNRTAVADLPEKELLVLACILPSHELQQKVMQFNQQNDQYYILMDIYDYEDERAIMRLDASLVSSSPPDLLDTSFWSLDINKYAGQQFLADLSPYLDQSELLHREEILPQLLEGYTINGRLCSIPSAFALNDVIMGRPGQVGTDMGWTLADVMALTEKYPDCQLLTRNSFSNLLYFCSDCILEEYIDWENGTCDFDNAGFRESVQWMWEHSKEAGLIHTDENYFWGIVPDNILLISQYINSPYSYPWRIFERGGEFTTVIGYPTADGQVRYSASAYDELCITAASKHQEAAWEFIEFYLSQRYSSHTIINMGDMNTFSTHRENLLQAIEAAATPTYERDEEGNIRLDAGGEPILQVRTAGYTEAGQMLYYCLEREQADTLLEMIDHVDFAPESGQKSTAIAIIDEELSEWVEQGKPLDEAIAIIQSRIRLLLTESG